jgi:predicted ATPase
MSDLALSLVERPGAATVSLPRPSILTPDRRVRVFVSSTLAELSAERLAARRAIDQLHLTPVMFEEGARPHPPRELYRSYLDQSDVFVGIYGQSYGWVAPDALVSGLEDEYLSSGAQPKLLYVKTADERAPRLQALLSRVQTDDLASYKHFDTPETLAELIADDLAVLLTERFAAPGADKARAARVTSLPNPPTDLIGRDADLAALSVLLCDETVHLVTLLGSGGIGKTRLAVEVARRLQDTADFTSVCFVDLAALRSPTDWAQTIATALGVRTEGTGSMLDVVIERLQDQQTLLVLDNFEHLMGAVSELGRLLARCQGLTVLVTSRIVLRLRGEREFTLAPLATPTNTSAAVDLDTVRSSPAVQLLTARAQDVRPNFSVTEANAEAVVELVRRLDGVPLALELVAAQLRLMTPHTVVGRLSEQLSRPLDLVAGQVDAPDRQRTLRATIDWSHGLLGEAEKVLLARISVLSPPWTLPLAEVVGTVDGDLDVTTALTSLVSQSLVRSEITEAEASTFRLLETIRDYARERLDERGGYDDAMGRLSSHLVEVVADVSVALEGSGNVVAAGQIDRRIGDLRATTDWALSRGDAETVIRLGAPLFNYWWSRGLLPYTHPLAERVASLPAAHRLTPEAATLLLWGRGMALIAIGRTDQAQPFLQQMVEATRPEDAGLHAHALFGLGLTLIHDNAVRAAVVLDQAAEEFRAWHLDWGLSITLSTRGGLALVAGDPVTATTMHREALAAADRAGNDHLRAQILDMLGLDAARVGKDDLARHHHARAAAIHVELLDQEGSAYGLSGFAGLALRQGQPEVAARLMSASNRALHAVGVAIWPGMQSSIATLTRQAESRLSVADYALAQDRGRQLTLPAAFEYALTAVPEGDRT